MENLDNRGQRIEVLLYLSSGHFGFDIPKYKMSCQMISPISHLFLLFSGTVCHPGIMFLVFCFALKCFF